MKKILLVLLVALGLQAQAQIMYCDSLSYTTSSSINYPFGITGDTLAIPGTISWTWTICNVNLCFFDTGQSAHFGQVSLSDTLKVCYDAIIDVSGFTYTCTDCDSLVYDVNLHTWRLLNMSNPTTIQELSYKAINNNKIYSLLGKELTEIPIGVMYIQNRKKYIKIK